MDQERAKFSATVVLTAARLRTKDGREVVIEGEESVGNTGVSLADRPNPLSLLQVFQARYGAGKENPVGQANSATLARAAREGSADFTLVSSFEFVDKVPQGDPHGGGGYVVFAEITAVITVRRELDG